MNEPDVHDPEKGRNRTGYAHIAFSLGSKEAADAKTEELRQAGFAVISGPGTTGDGYYESCVAVIEGNQIELTVQVPFPNEKEKTMGEKIVWLFIMIPVCLLFSGLGIYAMGRKKPMWFWSGTEVKDEEITDIPAYNRANGIMWLGFSAVFWISLFMGLKNRKAAGLVLIAGCIVGGLLLPVVYSRISERYRRKEKREDHSV